MTPEVVSVITSNLQGEDFCTNPENGFTEDQVEQCAENIGVFMPVALDAIGEAMIEYDNDICNDWYEGVCSERIFNQ